MRKRNPVDEFIRIMEEAVREMQEGRASIFIDVSIYPSQNLPQEIFVRNVNNTSVDILETEKKIHALLELPGVEEKDIVLSCNGQVLEVEACNAGSVINKTVELPSRVNKTGMKTTFKNGILEVVFNKSKKRALKGNAN